MKSEFVISNISTGKLNAAIKNIMAQTGITEPEEVVRMINTGKVQVSIVKQKWTEKDGIIRFSVTSDGTSGEEWIVRLESKGFRVSDYAKNILRSKNFKPTSATHEIAVLRSELFNDNERITKNIRKTAEKYNLATPNAEVACLIRENFSNKELKAMGLHWIIVMHEPIKNSSGAPLLLFAFQNVNVSWLDTTYSHSDYRWYSSFGFVFIVS